MKRRLSRRQMLGAGCTAAMLAPGVAFAQKKHGKKEAAYQPRPRGISMCSTCSFFQPPKSCAVVAGDVSPNGWCNLYAAVD